MPDFSRERARLEDLFQLAQESRIDAEDALRDLLARALGTEFRIEQCVVEADGSWLVRGRAPTEVVHERVDPVEPPLEVVLPRPAAPADAELAPVPEENDFGLGVEEAQSAFMGNDDPEDDDLGEDLMDFPGGPLPDMVPEVEPPLAREGVQISAERPEPRGFVDDDFLPGPVGGIAEPLPAAVPSPLPGDGGVPVPLPLGVDDTTDAGGAESLFRGLDHRLRVEPAEKRDNAFLQAMDPVKRARRLARALAGDIIAGQEDAHRQALAEGSEALLNRFGGDIEAAREEFQRQTSNLGIDADPIFQEALNHLLAGGDDLF